MKFCTTNSSMLDSMPISKAQLIFVQDTRQIYLDSATERIEYGQIIVLHSEGQRLLIASPLPTFYFVLETNVLWRYNQGWVQLTTPPKESIVFLNNKAELPATGQDNVLYITDFEMYRWDSQNQEYVDLTASTWENF